MQLKKTLAITGVISTIGLTSALGVGAVHAATSNNTNGNSLVDKIATTFHLNKDDVQKVFDQDRADREAQETANIETELTQLVTDGKITESQKSAILAKRTEMQQQRQANMSNMQSKTSSERKAALDEQRIALEKWASDNGLSTDYVRYVMGGHRGTGGPRGMNMMNDQPPANSSNQPSTSSTGSSSASN